MGDHYAKSPELDPLYAGNPFGNQFKLDELEETFEFLDDWESRYTWLIDLGRKIDGIPQNWRTEQYRVHGCQSQVWLLIRHDAKHNLMDILLDSDAMIVKGLSAVVMTALNRRSPSEVARFDMEALFDRLALIRHLSPTRGNGLREMVKRIQRSAAALDASTGTTAGQGAAASPAAG